MYMSALSKTYFLQQPVYRCLTGILFLLVFGLPVGSFGQTNNRGELISQVRMMERSAGARR